MLAACYKFPVTKPPIAFLSFEFVIKEWVTALYTSALQHDRFTTQSFHKL